MFLTAEPSLHHLTAALLEFLCLPISMLILTAIHFRLATGFNDDVMMGDTRLRSGKGLVGKDAPEKEEVWEEEEEERRPGMRKPLT